MPVVDGGEGTIDPGDEPYAVTFESPEDRDVIPMTVSVADTQNVQEIVVILETEDGPKEFRVKICVDIGYLCWHVYFM